MVETKPQSTPAAPAKKWDLNSLLEKVLQLQELLVASQESNLLLGAQTRELERIARDAEDLKSEITAQGLLLADKSRENRSLHQELTRVTTSLDAKIQEAEEYRIMLTDMQHQLRTRESERDMLAAMVNELEGKLNQIQAQLMEEPSVNKDKSWFGHFKGKP